MKTTRIIPLIALLALCCNSTPKENTEGTDTPVTTDQGGSPAITDASAALPLNTLKLPEGFKIEIYAEVENARSMVMSPSGTLFIGNRSEDKVYAVKDTDGDFKADKKWVIASGLNMPNGVAFKDGDLYVAEVSKISKFPGIESKLANPPAAVNVYDKFPTETHHGWKYIAFGPDGKLYVPVGAPCNICESKEPIYASITRMNADGTGLEVFASGVRNTVGFTWHPETKDIWFTDNGRDMLGNDMPPCELNTAPKAGMHFGYPYCHGGTIKDPEFGNKRPCSDFTVPAQNLGAHVAPLGLKFYTGSMFPSQYKNQLFIAEHGSWNRDKKSGYKVSLVKVDKGAGTSYETFASGWMDEATQKAWGRPVDVLLLPDGSMLVSDDQAGVIYRISYKS
ncbi:MAG: sorbosone dehydrogenase family protein [Cyclobacteriaceae bacterium]|nr:sorbosone dehydrogenase family protein [Cyclobacteriaceae bacterium]